MRHVNGRRANPLSLVDAELDRQGLEPELAVALHGLEIVHDGDAEPELKGSIGEGSNHSNFSDQSSVRIQEMLLEFIRNLKRSGMFNIFDNIWLEDLFEKSDMKMETS